MPDPEEINHYDRNSFKTGVEPIPDTDMAAASSGLVEDNLPDALRADALVANAHLAVLKAKRSTLPEPPPLPESQVAL